MSTPSAIPQGWERVERYVLAKLSGHDPATTAALEHWRQRVEKVRRINGTMEIRHVLGSEEAIKAVASFFVADLEEDRAIFRANLAKKKRRVAEARLLESIAEHEGFVPEPEKREQVVPELLAVVRISEAARHAWRKRLIEASRELATIDDNAMAKHASMLDDEIPEFKSDLLDFIKAHGEAGRKAVARTCDERDYAERLIADDAAPKPLRFLAGLVLEDVALHLPSDEPRRAFGFAAAR